MYSEKATKFCEISTVDLSSVHVVTIKSKVEILQNFCAFSEYKNFKNSISVFIKKSNLKYLIRKGHFQASKIKNKASYKNKSLSNVEVVS